MKYRCALVGNPNCGKTTLFNALTGSNQRVGNWPGVTVEKKEGEIKLGGLDASLVDLPGIYSLSPYSAEELIAGNYIIDEKPDLIINIVDASNLERNLYLTLQLSELGVPMVVALNMTDVLEKRGDEIDVRALENILGFRIIPISASKGLGARKLVRAVGRESARREDSARAGRRADAASPLPIYTGPLKSAVEEIEDIIEKNCREKNAPLRRSAVKLIEGDGPTFEALGLSGEEESYINALVKKIETPKIDREIMVADQKYKYIRKIVSKTVRLKKGVRELSISDKIDAVATDRFLAFPVFAAVMIGIFYITFGALGTRLSDLTAVLTQDKFAGFIRGALVKLNAADWVTGLVCDGVVRGLGSILTFFPQIALLFFFLSVLEDCGYMARVAFIMDGAARSIGLSGKSFVPMIMGFGCSVPALMATRTLENEKERRMTIMLVPFMSCGAKTPVYAAFISAFFASRGGLIAFSLYAIGLLTATLYSFVMRKTFLRGPRAPFVMELPPYRFPTLKTLGLRLRGKIRGFFSKAGTVLLGASVVVWALQYFNFRFARAESPDESALAAVGKATAPIFAPLGFGDWKSSVSALSGLMARESIISAMGILYGVEEGKISEVLARNFTPPGAYSFMTFTLLFVPCAAAVAAIRGEMNDGKRTALALAGQAVVSWAVTFVVYNIANAVYSFRLG